MNNIRESDLEVLIEDAVAAIREVLRGGNPLEQLAAAKYVLEGKFLIENEE